MQITAVFTPGAFVTDAEFWFRPMAELLEPRGINVRAIDLDSCGNEPPLGDLHSDAKKVRAIIDEIDGQIILCGHSYGGLVITEAAAGRASKVKHLVYISGIVTDRSIMDSDYIVPGQTPVVDFPDASRMKRTMLKLGYTTPGQYMLRLPGARAFGERLVRDGTVGEGAGADAFKSNELRRISNESMIEEGLKRVTRQSAASFVQAPKHLAYKEIPSTYILGLHDGEVERPQLMAQASRCSHLVEVPTNHFCHLDRPDLVADVIIGVAEKLGLETSVGEKVAG